jgi:hypothetical protein
MPASKFAVGQVFAAAERLCRLDTERIAAFAQVCGDASPAHLSDLEAQAFEGQSHAQYQFDDSAPETKEAFAEISAFFDKHMAK